MTEQIDLDWLERLAQTRSITASEIVALVAIARAVMQAGPWPRLRYAGTGHYQCWDCHETATGEDVEHRPDCRGVAVRDALAAIKGAGK